MTTGHVALENSQPSLGERPFYDTFAGHLAIIWSLLWRRILPDGSWVWFGRIPQRQPKRL